MLERLLEIGNSHALLIKQGRNICVISVVELLEEALRHERRSTAKRVVNYDDVLDVEQIIHLGHRHQSGGCAAASVCHREYGSRGTHAIAGLVENHLARIDLIPEELGDRLRNVGCARINAVDHQGLHGNCKVEPFEVGLIEPRLFPGFKLCVLSHFLTPWMTDLTWLDRMKVDRMMAIGRPRPSPGPDLFSHTTTAARRRWSD